MTEERMALAELLQKSGDGDFLRTVAEAVLQILMEADVEGLIGAGRHERTGDRQLSQWLSRAQPRHPPGLAPAQDPKVAPRLVLPALPGAAQDRRKGAGHGDPGSLDRRPVDPAGRRAGTGDGPQRHLREPSLQAVQKPAPAKAGTSTSGSMPFSTGRSTANGPNLWLDSVARRHRP